MTDPDVNLAGRISHFFAVNRPLSLLLLFVALVFGLVSFFLTPKQYNPEIVRPAFAVTVQYEGATVASAVDRVAYELIEKIDTVPGVEDIYTTVHDGARIETTVIFAVGYDATTAKLDLRSQLEQHSYLARGHIQQPHIIEINPETIPILHIVFGSDSHSVPELRDRVIELSRQLGTVPEVSELHVYGGYQPAMVVSLSPERLAASGLAVDRVVDTLQSSQLRRVQSGVRNEQYDIVVEFDGTAATPEEIGSLLIAEGVRIRDVANVYQGASGDRPYVFHETALQRGEVVMLSVAKVEGASAPVVSNTVQKTLAETLGKPAFTDISYQVVSDTGKTATAEIYGLTKNLLTSIGIVTLVLLLFLSTRAALVVLVAIPTTLLIVFGLGLLFDQTINRITLFALILSLGLLVDSAIVAVENIHAHLTRWHEQPTTHTRERVVATAIDEVGVGLLLSTITSVIVFLPMQFITGMMGPYMGPIAFFVPAALIVSFLVAIIVTPFIACRILRYDERPNRLSAAVAKRLDRLTQKYSRLLRSILYSAKKRRLLLRSALGLFIISLILPATGLVHFQMLPRADRDQFYLYLDLPVGTNQEETKRITTLVTGVVLDDPAVIDAQQFVATAPILDFNGLFKGAQNRTAPHQATVRVNLTPASERSRSSTDVVTAVRAAVATALPEQVEAVRFIEEPPGPPVQATFVAKLTAETQEQQQAAATSLATFISSVSGVVDVDTSVAAPTGQVRYVFDYAAAESLGVSPAAALGVLELLRGTYEVAELLDTSANEYTPIVLRLPALLQQSPNSIDQLSVPTQQGTVVPLRSVVKTTYDARPTAVHLEDAETVSYVTAAVEDRSIVYVVLEVMRQAVLGEWLGYEVIDWNLWGMSLTTETGEVIELVWGGEWEMTLENFRDLGIAMGVALLLVYALLVAQYRRFSTPAYILVTVPLGLIGILVGFMLLDAGFDIYLTATALIGFIALMGLVVNNAIIFLEYVEQSRRAGLSYREALISAGEARLRPILLTSLTTVLGSLTIASDPVWSGLAWAIVFGLSLSTVLTLLIYPTLLATFVADTIDNDDLQN